MSPWLTIVHSWTLKLLRSSECKDLYQNHETVVTKPCQITLSPESCLENKRKCNRYVHKREKPAPVCSGQARWRHQRKEGADCCHTHRTANEGFFLWLQGILATSASFFWLWILQCWVSVTQPMQSWSTGCSCCNFLHQLALGEHEGATPRTKKEVNWQRKSQCVT